MQVLNLKNSGTGSASTVELLKLYLVPALYLLAQSMIPHFLDPDDHKS
jgi:hypothetical protein